MAAASGQVSFVLRVVDGDEPGREIPIEEGRVTIGRRPSNDLVLREIQVSGVHAEVVLEGDRAVLRDLGSTNGTFLDGNRVDEVVLDHGETIGIGRARLLFLDASRGAAEPESPGGSQDRAGRSARAMAPSKAGALVGEAGAGHPDERAEGPAIELRGTTGKRRAPVVLLALLVVIVAAAVYFYLRPPASGRQIALAPRSDNVTGDLWSFEDASEVGDRLALSIPGLQPWRVQSTRARSGSRSLECDVAEGEGAMALVRALAVKEQHRYRVRIHVKAGSGATGETLLGAAWRAPAGRTVSVTVARGVPSPVSETEAYGTLEGHLDVPAGVAAIEVLIGAIGPGHFEADDMEVVDEGASPPARIESLDERHDYRTDESTLRLTRGGREVLVVGFPVLQIASSETSMANPARAAVFARTKLETTPRDDGLMIDVTVRNPLRGIGGWIGIDWVPASGEDRLRTLSQRGVEEYAASFETEAVEALLLGSDRGLIELRFAASVAVKSQEEEGVTRILIRPSPPGQDSEADAAGGAPAGAVKPALVAELRPQWQVGMELRVDFRAQAIEASRLVFDARQHLERGSDGEAYLLVEKLLNQLPYDEDEVGEARRIAQQIMTEGHRTQREIVDLMAVAAFLDSPTKLDEVANRAGAALERFGKTPLEDSLRALATEARTAVDRHRAARLESEAGRLFGVAEALRRQGDREGTAELIRRYIEKRFPGTHWAERVAGKEHGDS